MSLNVPMRRMEMPKGGKPPVRLMGFDYGPHLFHLLVFDFGDDGGAVGIWREGDNFCARISLDSLAEFWEAAKQDKAGPPNAGRELHQAALAVVEGLMRGDPAKDSPQGKALEQLAAAVEAYEKATLPPPFGNAGVMEVRHIDLEPPAEFFWNGERYRRKNNGQSVKLSDGSVHFFDMNIEVTPACGVTGTPAEEVRRAEAEVAEMRLHGNADDVTAALLRLERARLAAAQDRTASYGVAPSREPSRDQITAMVDAAMLEMSNIHPPLRRSECERLIRAAYGVSEGLHQGVCPNPPMTRTQEQGEKERI